MLSTIHTALDTLKERNTKAYDGVIGQPPEWMPWPLRDEFIVLRDRLLERGHTSREILRWMQAYVAESVDYPEEYARELEGLVYIRDISRLGEQDGLAAYLGTARKRVRRQYAGPARSATDVIAGHNVELKRLAAAAKADADQAGGIELRNAIILNDADRMRSRKVPERQIVTQVTERIERGELTLPDDSPIEPLSRKQISRIVHPK